MMNFDDFPYGESPFVDMNEDQEKAAASRPIFLSMAGRDHVKIVRDIDRRSQTPEIDDARMTEFSYMLLVFLCKACLYFVLQESYSRGYFSANL